MLKVKNRAQLEVKKPAPEPRPAAVPPAAQAAPAVDPARVERLETAMAQMAESVAQLPALIAANTRPAPAQLALARPIAPPAPPAPVVKRIELQVHRDSKGRMDRIIGTVVQEK